MSISNINTVTGVRFGVLSGNSLPELVNEIMSNGDDLSFEAYKKDLCSQLSDAIGGVLNNNYLNNRNDADEMASEIVDSLEFEDYQCDEPNYSYTDNDGNEYLLGWLGGASLIWFIKSDRLVSPNSLCSPCVPHAGDLDSGESASILIPTNLSASNDLSGLLADIPFTPCYGLPSDWLECWNRHNDEKLIVDSVNNPVVEVSADPGEDAERFDGLS